METKPMSVSTMPAEELAGARSKFVRIGASMLDLILAGKLNLSQPMQDRLCRVSDVVKQIDERLGEGKL